MEQQPVKRRRRRRRSSKTRSETIAWLTYIFSLGQRVYHWLGLLFILGLILFLGLGAPIMSFEEMVSFWGHW